MRNAALYAAGLVMGSANRVRHVRRGYVRPRPFDPAEVDRTIRHALEIVDRLEQRGGIEWHGKRVLELGPGSDLTTGAIMLHRGAASYLAIDAFDNREQAHPRIYDRLGEFLGAPIETQLLGFQLASFPEIPEVRGNFDLFVSNATLEHLNHVGYLFRNLRRLAAPAAQMVHHVDAQTHMRWIKDVDPLNILRYRDAVYRTALNFTGAPNRLRSSDYVQLAELHGWSQPTIVPGRAAPDGYLERTRVAPRFRAYGADLGHLTFTINAHAPREVTSG